MRTLLMIVLLAGASCFGRSEEIMPGPWYNVVSDVESAEVPNGKCKVIGKALYGEEGVANAKISNLTGTHQTMTKADGSFELLIPATDTAIFFYHVEYQEIVVWNYPFQNQHEVTINFHTWEARTGMEVEEKPVIYCYSNELKEMEVSLERADKVTHSYPVYEDSWKFKPIPYEQVQLSTHQPYLFYEAETEDLSFNYFDGIAQGDFIESDEVINYLEARLEGFGMNDIETTHFITYWGPRLKAKKYAFIQFLVDDECDEAIGELIITPKPDHQRRIYIVFQTTDLPIQFHDDWKERNGSESIPEFSRDGLTVIEWGGTELNRKLAD